MSSSPSTIQKQKQKDRKSASPNKEEEKRTLTVLSQLPVASSPPEGVSTHRTHLIGASCCATCGPSVPDWPVARSNMRAALSAPHEMTFDPSCGARAPRRVAGAAMLMLMSRLREERR